jgi:starch synthase (maltosyl-transferring)
MVAMPMPMEGRRRVVIEGVQPEVDCGRFPIKRTIGEEVVVEADIFTDGHDAVGAALLHRNEADRGFTETPMVPLENDRWRGSFGVGEVGRYRYTLRAWVDRFATWRGDLEKRVEAGQDVGIDLLIGADLVERGARRAPGEAGRKLRVFARRLREDAGAGGARPEAADVALDPELSNLMSLYPDRRFGIVYGRELWVVVDRERARFGAWYEMFPRSAAAQPGRHGTFADVERRLPYVAGLGFDVLYFPPIHAIGETHRKGRNNATDARRDDPGSPWAIGSAEGGHTAVHPDLGTLEDFDRLVRAAGRRGLEIALDLAFQCSPDHPYVKEHPEWFRHRPDGTIQYAENPPKKYEDIYPLDFETENWRELWNELAGVVRFWIGHGVRIFRVDNPHTKPFGFWEWLIGQIKADHPDVLFLSEAFTRPKVMYRLAKVGFSQSYTYFAWRTSAWELRQYFEELTRTQVAEYFRPNLWPNTPDILTEELQSGGRAAFTARLILAATLGASYGIYGQPFELMENVPLRPGSEEYMNSEKYEVRHWDWDPGRLDSLAELTSRINRIRRENPALQTNRTLRFHDVDNGRLLVYSKTAPDGSNPMVMAVNVDHHYAQSGWIHLDLDALGLDPEEPYRVHDLLTDARYTWRGAHNYIELNPNVVPAHVFRISQRGRARTEQDFEYFA